MRKITRNFLALCLASCMVLFNANVAYAATYINGDTIQEDEDGKVSAEEMTEEQAEATQEFLDSTEVTENFVVYADEFSQNSHLDGNMCVNDLSTNTETTHYDWNQETQSLDIYTANDTIEGIKNSGQGNETVYNEDGDELDDYSIVINGNNDKVGHIDGGEILVGDNISVNNVNDSSQFISVELDGKTQDEIGETIADAIIDVKEDITEEEKVELRERIIEEVKINENLQEIAAAGEELIESFESQDPTSAQIVNYAKFKLLPSFDSDTIVTFTVTSEDLKSQDFANAIDNLLRENKSVGAKIILNISTNGEESLTIAHPINGNDAYDISTGYLVWNFGDYDGSISYSFTTEGNIIAPNAIVNFNVMDGRIVANKVVQGSGQEIHMPYTTEKIEKPKEEETPPDEDNPEEEEEEEETPPETEEEEETPPPSDNPPTDTPPGDNPPNTPPSNPIEEENNVNPNIINPTNEENINNIEPSVLGARREQPVTQISEQLVPTTANPAVLGARRAMDKAVLGKRRCPDTGDNGDIVISLCIMIISACGLCIWYILYKNKKRKLA